MPLGRLLLPLTGTSLGLFFTLGLAGCRNDPPVASERPPARVVQLLADLLPLQANPQPALDTPRVLVDRTFDEGPADLRSSQLRSHENGVIYLREGEEPPTLEIPVDREAAEVTVLEVAFAVRSGTAGTVSWKRSGESDWITSGRSIPVFVFGDAYREPTEGFQRHHVFLEDDPEWRGRIESLRLELSDVPTPAAVDSLTLFHTRLRSRYTLEGGPLGLLRYRLGEESIEIAYAPTPMTFPKQLSIPENAALRLAYGVTAAEWRRGDAVRFRVVATSESGETLLFEKVLEPRRHPAAAWQWADVDLRPRAGQTVELRFETQSVGTERSIDALWGAARLIVAGDQKTPNVLMICLDTLRADRLGHYGYDRPTSPRLDALAREGIVFEQAFGQVATTLESHASMFTGLYPAQHGVAHDSPVGPLAPTLAAALRRHGYTTVGFCDSGYASDDFGLGAGFDRYHERYEHLSKLDDKIDRFLAWQAESADMPYFAFFHTYAVHSPYEPEPLDRWRDFLKGDYAGSLEVPISTERLFDLMDGTLEPTPEDFVFLSAVYDACIRSTDEKIGRLLDTLRDRGELDNTLVMLVSDHGEGFGEHGMLLHGFDLHREQVHVPWVIRPPKSWAEQRGWSPARIEGLVELVDVPATLLDMLGFSPTEHLSPQAAGRSWVPLLAGRGRARNEVLAFVPRAVGEGSALRTEQLLLFEMSYLDDFALVAPERRRLGPYLFDLTQDPAERTNLAADRTQRLDGARRALAGRVEDLAARRVDLSGGASQGLALTDAMRAELKRLGYLGK